MPIYPVNDFGPLMPGLVIAGAALVHVFLAQFAVGGGMLLCWFQWLAMTGRSQHARQFLDGYFKLLVLISFVVGALTGVGIWFTTIQVSAPTIGMLVFHFHWLWASEWAFFCLEIVSGYCFYRYHDRLSDRAALALLVIYSIAAWFSLCLINGILSWQLTPGNWLEHRTLASGFFNPSFGPSLFFRTVVSTTLAALAACLVVNTMSGLERSDRRSLIGHASLFLAPMIVMPLLGGWYLAVMPDDSREWVLGGSPAMTMFFAIAVLASLAVGAYAVIGLFLGHLYINAATAALLLFLAFGATAGGEFVREGSRKPFSIRHVLYSNGIPPEDVARLRIDGCLADDPYPLRNPEAYPTGQLRTGARVFRRLCSVCHTIDGANGLRQLVGTWDENQMRMNIAKLQQTKPFMPPFAGRPDELEALVQFLNWCRSEKPGDWSDTDDPQVVKQIQQWLDEAGVEPAMTPRRARAANAGSNRR